MDLFLYIFFSFFETMLDYGSGKQEGQMDDKEGAKFLV